MKIENVNMGYTIGFVMVVSFGFFYMGYTFIYFNSLTFVLHKQYVARLPAEPLRNFVENFVFDRDVFNSSLSSLIIIGAIIGSILGGPLVEKGRRRALILLAIGMIINSFILCIFNLYCLLFGRFFEGIIIGCFTVISPLFVKEIAPKCIAGPLGAFNQLMNTLGSGVALSISFIVPLNEEAASFTSDSWRILFIVPAVFAVAQLGFLMYFKYESPTFYNLKQN